MHQQETAETQIRNPQRTPSQLNSTTSIPRNCRIKIRNVFNCANLRSTEASLNSNIHYRLAICCVLWASVDCIIYFSIAIPSVYVPVANVGGTVTSRRVERSRHRMATRRLLANGYISTDGIDIRCDNIDPSSSFQVLSE